MAEEEKQHEPSARRKEQFFEKGDLARSRDATASAALFGVVLSGAAVLPYQLNQTALYTYELHSNLHNVSPALLSRGVWILLGTVMPIAAAGLLGVMLVGAGFGGGRIPFAPLKIDLTRLNPITKMVQIFFSTEALGNVAAAAIKVLVIAAVATWLLWDQLVLALTADPTWSNVVASSGRVALTFGLMALLVLLVVSTLDYAMQWQRHQKKLRMTHKELKDEAKEDMGDPHIRNRRRRRHQEIMKSRTTVAVKESDVVVVNPTHYAVALQYKQDGGGAPRVMAKGKNWLAKRIRTAARQSGVPIVHQPPLTRGLYRTVPVGDEIPAAFFEAVAAVLANVYRARGRAA